MQRWLSSEDAAIVIPRDESNCSRVHWIAMIPSLFNE